MNIEISNNQEISNSNQEINTAIFNLENKIGKKYGILYSTLEELIKFKTNYETNYLKIFLEQVEKNTSISTEQKILVKNLDQKILNELISEIENTKIQIQKLSIKDRLDLKSDLFNISEVPKIFLKIFPKNFITSSQNPINFVQNINGGFLGAGKSLYNLGKGTLGIIYGFGKSPYDFYLLISGKGEYNGWKNI